MEFVSQTESRFVPCHKRQQQSEIVGMFSCPNCKTRFSVVLKGNETASIKNIAEKIQDIAGALMKTLKKLREKIKTLESERANLLLEIEKLRKIAEDRANALETEVDMLREEVSSLREILGYTEEIEK